MRRAASFGCSSRTEPIETGTENQRDARFWKLGNGVVEAALFIIVAGHLTNVCVTLFLHRAQTHRSVKLHYLAALPMRLWLWLSTAIVTKEWVACHRKHHAFADREGDPHSPLLEGLRNIVLKGAFYYRTAVRQPGVLEKYGKGTPNDWIERALLTPLNWVGILVMLVADLYLFGFFVGPIVWGVQMIWIPFWAAGIINGVGHALGYRNFEVKDESRNISPIAIWLGGEELHNNHHADPHSAKFKAKWYEFDIGWVYIRLLSLFGSGEGPVRAQHRSRITNIAHRHGVARDTDEVPGSRTTGCETPGTLRFGELDASRGNA